MGHLQFTKMYIEENYTEYDHSIGAYSKHSTRCLCQMNYTYCVNVPLLSSLGLLYVGGGWSSVWAASIRIYAYIYIYIYI